MQRGDVEGGEEVLREAHRLFLDFGATGNAHRVAETLAGTDEVEAAPLGFVVILVAISAMVMDPRPLLLVPVAVAPTKSSKQWQPAGPQRT